MPFLDFLPHSAGLLNALVVLWLQDGCSNSRHRTLKSVDVYGDEDLAGLQSLKIGRERTTSVEISRITFMFSGFVLGGKWKELFCEQGEEER